MRRIPKKEVLKMFRRGLHVVSLLMLGALLSCTTVAPSIAFSGLPTTIVGGNTYTLTLIGSPGTSAGL